MEQITSSTDPKETTIEELTKYRCNLIKETFTSFYELNPVNSTEYIQTNVYIKLIDYMLKTRFSEFDTDNDFERSFDGSCKQSFVKLIPPLKFTNFFITVERRIVIIQLREALEWSIWVATKSGHMHSKEFLNDIFEKHCLPDIRAIDNQLVADVKELQTFISRPDINEVTLLLIQKGLIKCKDVIPNSAELIEQIKLHPLIKNKSSIVCENINTDANQDGFQKEIEEGMQEEQNSSVLLEVDDIDFSMLLEMDNFDFSMLLETIEENP